MFARVAAGDGNGRVYLTCCQIDHSGCFRAAGRRLGGGRVRLITDIVRRVSLEVCTPDHNRIGWFLRPAATCEQGCCPRRFRS